MWGNTLGWCISALIVLVTIGLLTWLDAEGRNLTPRTDFSRDSRNGDVIELPVSATAVLPKMIDPTDAGPIYRRALVEYEKTPFIYAQFARSGAVRDIEDILPAINILPEATHCAGADLFASSPRQIVNLMNEKAALEALKTLGTCARRAGQLMERNRPDEAMKLYEAVFSLGVKLFRERLTYAELDAGLTMMAEGSTLIRKLADSSGDAVRVQAIARFDEVRKTYVNDHILPVYRVIGTLDQATLEEHAGDVFHFARYAPERMWRVEAIFKLARYRFNADKVADQRIAMKVLRELAQDRDPVIATAAIAGRDLTIEQYRMLH